MRKNIKKPIVQIKQNGNSVSVRRFHDYIHHINPFDLVLFKGNDFVSNLIVSVEGFSIPDDEQALLGVYSHCGVIVNTSVMTIPNAEYNKWYVLEITASGKIANDEILDTITKKGLIGVQVRDLEQLVNHYNGQVFIGHINVDLDLKMENESKLEYNERMNKIKGDIDSFYHQYKNSYYQFNIIRLLSSMCDCLRPVRKYLPISKNWIFCSQLCALLYQKLGLLSDDITGENVTPVDFIYRDRDNEIIDLISLPPIQLIS